MPDKTARLAGLLPEVYAARFGNGVLHRLLDAFGVELATVDAAVKRLLPSHWIEHAQDEALDGLAATFGQRRRIQLDGTPESDEALRQRLRALVARFTGGGTVEAVKGVVRSALGLPFDLTDLQLPPDSSLGAAIEQLVTLTEFSPEPASVRQTASATRVDNNRSRLDVVVDLPSVQPDRPVITLTVTKGFARNISVQLEGTDSGVRAQPQLVVRPGESLILETVLGGFAARVVGVGVQRSVGYLFSALDGGPAQVPLVPVGTSTWIFRAGSGFTGVPSPAPRPRPGEPRQPQWSAFDEDTFDLPSFEVNLSWTVYTPLTFDLSVPYFLDDAVLRLRRQYGFTGRIFTHEGMPREQIQDVVDVTRAAGVRGRLSFWIGLPIEGADRHDVDERLALSAAVRLVEQAGAAETLSVGSVSSITQVHDQGETLWIGGVFDVSTFDDPNQGFLG